MKAALKKFEQFIHYPLFASAGQPVSSQYHQVKSWETAVSVCTSQKWENCRLMARNVLQEKMEAANRWERYEEWNPIAEKLRPKILSFISELQTKAPVPEGVIETIQHDLSWDILAICLEHDFSDTITPFFAVPLLDRVYASGHLPCGWTGLEFKSDWDGTIQNGKLMVY